MAVPTANFVAKGADGQTTETSELEHLERSYAAFAMRRVRRSDHLHYLQYVRVGIRDRDNDALHKTNVCVCVWLPTALYLTVMLHMPNSIYYAQFTNMDAANLKQTVINVLLYTMFELLSYVAASVALHRLLRISPMRQLAFVLTQQAVHVQSAMILWVVFSTQASLHHYGKVFALCIAFVRVARAKPP